MINSAIMKAGELLEVPFVNKIIPVDVYLNGDYKGSYAFTEQIEVKENRVNIRDGYLLELDTYYDEEYKYYSPVLDLPVMLKDTESDLSDDVMFETHVKADFNELESALTAEDFPNNGYDKLVDLESVAALFLANEIALNRDLPYIKSLFIFKEKGEKFKFGPIWDFDWGCGYKKASCIDHFDPEYYEEELINRHVAHNNRKEREDFLANFYLDPNFVATYKKVWNKFYGQKTVFYNYLDSYAATLKDSADANFELWDSPYGRSFDEEYKRMKVWFEKRIEHMNVTIQKL